MLSVSLKSKLPSPISVIVNHHIYFKVNYSFNIIFQKKIVAYLLFSAVIMLLNIATNARPQITSRYSNNTPTTSKFSNQSFSKEYEKGRLKQTNMLTTNNNTSQRNRTVDKYRTKNKLRHNVDIVDSELSSSTSLTTIITSKKFSNAKNQIYEPQRPEPVLNRLEPTTQNLKNENSQSTLSFLQQSRNAFLRLNSRTFVKSPLLPEEERRQIWLERYRHKGVDKLTKKILFSDEKDLPGRKRILALPSVDFINNNNSCTGDLFKHKVRMAGCEPKIIINRFCYGNCASYYIPKLRYKKFKATFQSCAACVPSEYDHVEVKLNCPGREMKELYRTVMRVKKCKCQNIELDDEDENSTDADELRH